MNTDIREVEQLLRSIGIQIAQPKNEKNEKIMLFNLYSCVDMSEKKGERKKFGSDDIRRLSIEFQYTISSDLRTCSQRISLSDARELVVLKSNVLLKHNQTQRQRGFNLVKEKLNNLSPKEHTKQQIWLDYNGLCEVAFKLERWEFLKVAVSNINSRYGRTDLGTFQVRQYHQENPIARPSLTVNRNNKDTASFLALKCGIGQQTKEEIATIISDYLNSFFSCDQILQGNIKPNLILKKLLEKHEPKIEANILNELHNLWWDVDVQMTLLGISGISKRKWTNLYTATCQATRGSRMIIPEFFGKHQHRMPKLFQTYSVIKKHIKAKHKIETSFDRVQIPEMTITNQLSTQSNTQDSSQPSSLYSTSSESVPVSSKRKRIDTNSSGVKKRKLGRSLSSNDDEIPQVAYVRNKDSFIDLCHNECRRMRSKLSVTHQKLPASTFISIKDSLTKLCYPQILPDQSNDHIHIPARELSLFVAGDAALVHKYASKNHRKHITHMWMRSLPSGKEELLGISEGKDGYNVLYSLLPHLDLMREYEQSGLVVDGELYFLRFHWGGDLAYLLNLVGLQSASCKHWCPDCMQASTGGTWWINSTKRNLKLESDGISKKVYVACRVHVPIIRYWLVSGRIHFCNLHANISIAKGLIKAMVYRALRDDILCNNLKNCYQTITKFDALVVKYGQDLSDIDQYEQSECIQDFQMFLKDGGKQYSGLTLSELIQEVLGVYEMIMGKLDEVVENKYHMPIIDQKQRLQSLQKLFYRNNISIRIIDCLDEKRSPSVIGDHAIMILECIEEVRKVISLSDEEVVILKKMRRLLSALLSLNPSEEDQKLFMEETSTILRQFIESFGLKPWNYCHLLATHMKDDMIGLKKRGFTLAMVGMSRIESLGAKLKRIMKHQTNHNMQDKDEKREHCIIQAIRYYYWEKESLYKIVNE